MRERCPGCRRSVDATDARCPRCGTALSGVELEGAELAFGGDELVLGRASAGSAGAGDSGEGRGRARRWLAIGGAVVVIGAGLRFLGTDRSSTSAAPTTAASTTTTATTAPPATEPPTSIGEETPTEPSTSTTSTTIERRQVRSPDGLWSARVEHRPGNVSLIRGGAASEHLGLTIVDTGQFGDGSTVRFTDLDTGERTDVSISIDNGGGGYNSPALFAGGAIVQLQLQPLQFDAPGPTTMRFTTLEVLASGDVHVIDGAGRLLATDVYSGRPLGSTTWFVAADDEHRLLLVDLASRAIVRTVTTPPAAIAVGIYGDDPLVTDASGRSFTIDADGSLHPLPAGGPGKPAGGRIVTPVCDDALTACHDEYVDEEGRRTAIEYATGGEDPVAIPAPAGRRLVALVPAYTCSNDFCDPAATDEADRPIEVLDIESGRRSVIGLTNAQVARFRTIQPYGNPVPVSWSSDGAWLFYPTSDDATGTSAWRPGLMTPMHLDLPFTIDPRGFGNFHPMLAFPTPATT